MENESIEEFDHRFERIGREFPTYCKPPDAMVLSYYLKAFLGYFIFHLSLDSPIDLPSAKKKVKVLDDSWKDTGRPYTSRYFREKPEPKNKEKNHASSESLDLMNILIE